MKRLSLLPLLGLLAGSLAAPAQTNSPAAQPAAVITPAASAPVEAPAPAVAKPAAAPQPGTVIPLIVMDDVPLTDAIRNLARQAGLNYLLDPRIGFGQPGADGKPMPQPSVSIRWENITAEQALSALLSNFSLQLIEDPKSKIARITTKDPAAPDPLTTHIYQLKYANPSNIVVNVQAALTDKRSKVLPDIRTSQLIVVATEKEFPPVDELIQHLDTQTKQVLIEARLLETMINPTTTKGIDWSGTLAAQHVSYGNGVLSGNTIQNSSASSSLNNNQNSSANSSQNNNQNSSANSSQNSSQNQITSSPGTPITVTYPGGQTITYTPSSSTSSLANSGSSSGSSSSSSTAGSSGLGSLASSAASGLSSSGVSSLLNSVIGNGGLSLDSAKGLNPSTFFLNADGVKAVLSFLNTYSDSKVLDAPRTVTLDNEEARIEVGTFFPIVNVTAGTAQTSGGSQITYSNLTVALKVTPRISANDYIKLTVDPTITRLGPQYSSIIAGTANSVYSFLTRQVHTTALIPSGNTLVLGGLIEDNIGTSNTKVPLLGDLPIIGLLFRNDSKSRTKSNLIIFLTPTIVQEEDFQPTKSTFLKAKVPIKDAVEGDWSAWDSGKPMDWRKKLDVPQEQTFDDSMPK